MWPGALRSLHKHRSREPSLRPPPPRHRIKARGAARQALLSRAAPHTGPRAGTGLGSSCLSSTSSHRPAQVSPPSSGGLCCLQAHVPSALPGLQVLLSPGAEAGHVTRCHMSRGQGLLAVSCSCGATDHPSAGDTKVIQTRGTHLPLHPLPGPDTQHPHTPAPLVIPCCQFKATLGPQGTEAGQGTGEDRVRVVCPNHPASCSGCLAHESNSTGLQGPGEPRVPDGAGQPPPQDP